MNLQLAVPDLNDSVSTVALAGIVYELRFTWNDAMGWTVAVLIDGDLQATTRIVAEYPLFAFTPDLLPGMLWASGDVSTREAFTNGAAALYYLEGW